MYVYSRFFFFFHDRLGLMRSISSRHIAVLLLSLFHLAVLLLRLLLLYFPPQMLGLASTVFVFVFLCFSLLCLPLVGLRCAPIFPRFLFAACGRSFFSLFVFGPGAALTCAHFAHFSFYHFVDVSVLFFLFFFSRPDFFCRMSRCSACS